MNKVMLFVLTGLIHAALIAGPAYSAEKTESDVRIPAGMEVEKAGDVNIVVPKGGQLRREEGRIYLESTDEYASREFDTVAARLDRIEAEQKALGGEIVLLKEALDKKEDKK
ncbi:MAG: hypothetical protein WC515_01260 [Candidatus Omnitrophota bacterium]